VAVSPPDAGTASDDIRASESVARASAAEAAAKNGWVGALPPAAPAIANGSAAVAKLRSAS
jgi:hypothetical protein